MRDHQRVEPVGDVLPLQRRIERQAERADLGIVTVGIVRVDVGHSAWVTVAIVARALLIVEGRRIEPAQGVLALSRGIVDIGAGEIGRRGHRIRRRTVLPRAGIETRQSLCQASARSRLEIDLGQHDLVGDRRLLDRLRVPVERVASR